MKQDSDQSDATLVVSVLAGEREAFDTRLRSKGQFLSVGNVGSGLAPDSCACPRVPHDARTGARHCPYV